MTPSTDKYDGLYTLLDDLCDGSISASNAARLDCLLREDPAARREYLSYLDVHAGLGLLSGKPLASYSDDAVVLLSDGVAVELPHQLDLESQIPEPRTPNPEPPLPSLSTTHYPLPTTHFSVGSWAFSYMVATVIMGVVLLGFWAYKITHHQHIAESPAQSAPSDAMPEMVFVGRITGMVDVKWSDDPRYLPPPDFAHVPLGRKYILSSGLLQITYDSGAKVILEGPCTYEVESTAGGYLALGKLTARVGEYKETKRQGDKEKKADAAFPHLLVSRSPGLPVSPLFSVRTPTAVVTDLGTEFGVEVDERGCTESYVFVGKVRLAAVGRQAGNATDQVLLAGQAGRVDGESVVVATADGDGTRFVRKLPTRKPLPEPPPEVELIGRIDYSDTWTVDSPTRFGGYRILTSPEELQVEQCHGNPQRSWVFSVPTAVTTWPSGPLSDAWPGPPTRGARSGFTEAAHGSTCYLGLEYDLRDDFVVQFNAVQTYDRINITIGDEPATLDGARSLSVFFRDSGGPHPEIGLYMPSKGEVDTKLRSGVPAPFRWHNYATRFNLREKRLTVWVDGECRGTIDLADVARGMETEEQRTLAGLPWTAKYVTVGGHSLSGGGNVWTDDFRLGAPAKNLAQEKPITKGEQNHEVDMKKQQEQ